MGIETVNSMNSHSVPDNKTIKQQSTSESTTISSVGNNVGSTTMNTPHRDVVVGNKSRNDPSCNKDSETSHFSTNQEADRDKHANVIYVCLKDN